MKQKKKIIIKIIISISEMILSIISFALITLLDPLKISATQSLSSIPAFFVSLIIILIGNTITNVLETQRSNENYEKIHDDVEEHHKKINDAVKNHLNVIPIGVPQVALSYVFENLQDINDIENTSFTLEDETDVADIQLYSSNLYNQITDKILEFVSKGGIWRDIGDEYAQKRFTLFENSVNTNFPQKVNNYKYRLLLQSISQINFILLNYKDGKKEVLFNWDFKSAGQTPIVLLSRDYQIINMFSAHFEYLWRAASIDHDSIATKSTSVQ